MQLWMLMGKINFKFILCFGLIGFGGYFYSLISNQPMNPKRQVASVRKVPLINLSHSSPFPIVKENGIHKNLGAVSSKEVELVDPAKLDQSDKMAETWNFLKEGRSMLNPETIIWSERFPTPTKLSEEEFLLKIQLNYQVNRVTLEAINSDNVAYIKSRIKEIREVAATVSPLQNSYVEICLSRLDPYTQREIINSLIYASYLRWPNIDLRAATADQLEIYFEEPSRYSNEDYKTFRDFIEISNMFEDESKDIISEMDRVRNQF